MNVCVPTGNFGNIFAAYIARLMGLPIGKLICASNTNNVLTDFLNSGVYNRNRDFHMTISPSMDILISSNLERLLYFTAGAEKTAAYMSRLKSEGKYSVDSDILASIGSDFKGYYASEADTSATIKDCFAKNGELIDTHTAVGLYCARKYIAESGDNTVMVVASTASPYKFAADVYTALTDEKPEDALAALDLLSEKTGTAIPYPLEGIASRRVRFTETINTDEMASKVLEFAK